MSLNKRHYNINKLRLIYKDGGLESIIDIFKKIDVYYFEDDESSAIFNLINSIDMSNTNDIIKDEINIILNS